MANKNFVKLKFIIFVVVCFLQKNTISAETVILRSHEVIQGRVIFQDVNILRIIDDSGNHWI